MDNSVYPVDNLWITFLVAYFLGICTEISGFTVPRKKDIAMVKPRDANLKNYFIKRIEDGSWLKHIAIVDNRIYRVDTMTDVTDQKTIQIDNFRYNVRKVAFFVIHGRWPARNFLLPWE